ncbi:TadE family protein [Sinanaerobacter chloroacetimidivorans]|jgi:hypothetical protein|uniref:Pilus assembly protein n=1 Tax=Sinanaerobacter chloroacetimidivorans TaxID=2818044 RepID=A0A8J7VWK1_9FIRM|nr:TadE family protein [Sinanaerobacter chloroacetimidivorans]MBR0596367.1 pilus assembly protein [Sinanaerobacter chloroacetimidivorans]
MKLKTKKGAALVEASMIFPLVIAGVMAVLYIVIGLYSALSLQSNLHIALRQEAGKRSETVCRENEVNVYDMEESKIGLRTIISMEEKRNYRTSSLFNNKVSRTEKGQSYVIDEADLVRKIAIGKEVLQFEISK